MGGRDLLDPAGPPGKKRMGAGAQEGGGRIYWIQIPKQKAWWGLGCLMPCLGVIVIGLDLDTIRSSLLMDMIH